MTTEVDSTIEGEVILEFIGMGHHLDLWMIEIEIALRSSHEEVFLAEEGISMTVAEVVDEGTLKVAVEAEEDEEGGE